MKLCSICHWLLKSRRWLLLPIGLAVSLLLALIAPVWLWLTLCAALLLIAAMLIIYVRGLNQIWSSCHLRMPAPRDAHAEMVMIDASLVGTGTQVQAVSQPLISAPELNLRMGSGALLLGTAMIFLADELPAADKSALLAAAARLNLHAPVLLQRSPILRRGTENGMTCITVQDGTQERTYFMADAATVAKGCGSIWEERVRLMGQHDQTRIQEAAARMAEGGRRVIAFATATDADRPIFLGLAALGDGVEPGALKELNALRAMGLTTILRDDQTCPMNVSSLRRSLDIPDLHARPDLHLCVGDPYPSVHCLAILRTEDRSLLSPVLTLREHFSRMALMLRRLFGLMGLCFLCCILAGGVLSVPAAAAILTAAYLSFGNLANARPVRWPEAAAAAGFCLLVRLLLNAAVPAASGAAGTCLCIALTALLSLTLAAPERKGSLRRMLPPMLTAGAALLVQLLVVLPMLPAMLLPACFCIVCGFLAGFVLLFFRR